MELSFAEQDYNLDFDQANLQSYEEKRSQQHEIETQRTENEEVTNESNREEEEGEVDEEESA